MCLIMQTKSFQLIKGTGRKKSRPKIKESSPELLLNLTMNTRNDIFSAEQGRKYIPAIWGVTRPLPIKEIF